MTPPNDVDQRTRRTTTGHDRKGQIIMRKVISYLLFSLDGVAQSPDRWVGDFDAELAAHLEALIASQDAVLLGRTTYQEWAAYWPTSSHEPFASFINSTPKYVASTTLTQLTWQNAMLIKGSPADQIARLKSRPGRDIGVHGSPRLVRSLLRDDLIDELRLAVSPVIAGTGQRLFDGHGPVRRMQLAEAQPTSTGAILLTYYPLTVHLGRASLR
jgi:dihydrofolate reductase